jgi:hypothetical protein
MGRGFELEAAAAFLTGHLVKLRRGDDETSGMILVVFVKFLDDVSSGSFATVARLNFFDLTGG